MDRKYFDLYYSEKWIWKSKIVKYCNLLLGNFYHLDKKRIQLLIHLLNKKTYFIFLFLFLTIFVINLI